MANPKVKFKRSSVAGKVPGVGDLPLGEIAINTNDGIVYTAKSTDGGLTTSIVNVSGIQIQDEGSLVGYANTLNFVGSGLTVVSVSGGIGIVSFVDGGSSAVSIGTTSPSTPSAGDLWYNSNLGRIFIYYNDGSSSQWVDAAPFNVAEEATLTPAKNTTSFIATAGQTTFSVNYQIGYVEVYVNGARLSDSEYTATNGTQIVLLESASEGDVVDVVEFIIGRGDPGPEGPAGASGKLEDLTSTTSASTHYPIIVTGVGSTAPSITTTTNYFSFVPSTGTLTANNLVVSGTSGTSLLVQGNARVVGILTIGSSSVTINGNSNQVNVGTAVTIHTGGFRVGNSDLHSNGLTVNNLNVSGVLTATTFVGDGSGLTGAGSTVSDDVETNATFYPVLTQTTSGTITESKVSTTKLSFNPSSGTLSATTFSGNATSANYATSAGISTYSTTAGISTDATKLQTPRTISLSGDVVGSISFDGSSDVSIAATIQSNSVALGDDTTGNYVQSITGTSNQITVTSGEGEGSSPTLSIPNQFTIPQDVTVTRDLQVNRNLNVSGNITLGGTTAFINAAELRVSDPDIVLGFRSDAGGNDISTDNTANHGGIAVASTEGSPLINLYDVGIGETNPSTYKKFMWFKSGTFSGLGTDAWISNYAVGIGSTQFPDGTRLAAGSIQFTERDLSVVRNINSSGVVTATSFVGSLSGTATTATNLSDAANITTGTINSARLSGTYNISISGNAATATNADTLDGFDSSAIVLTRSTSVNTNSTDFNTIVTAGTYQVGGNGNWTGSTNSPSSAYSFGQLVVTVNGSIVTQNYFTHATSGHWIRSKYNTSDWQPWQEYWTSANQGSGSGLDADLWDGYHLSTRGNWSTNSANAIVTGQLSWRNYGNNHTIFDASASLSPDGTSVNNANAQIAWSGTYPTLMGWNGANTFGVRVDSARISDSTSGSSASCTGNSATATNISNSGTVTLATATESNSIYITQPSYVTDQPVKLLNFDWYGNIWSLGNIRSGSTPSNGFGVYSSGTERARFTTSGLSVTGSISATGNVTAYSSDKRLKENFKHIENPLEKIQKLNGYTFDWNKKSEELGFTPQHKKNDVGLIAQEVQEVLPQAAVLAPFDRKTDENGETISKSGENYLTIQYERLVPLLIEAIKEQQEQINILKEEINNLKK